MSRFSVENFCLTVPKYFVEEPFDAVFQKFSGSEKVYGWVGGGGGRGREDHDFQSKIFCLTVPKNFVGESFCAVFQKISGSEKVYG